MKKEDPRPDMTIAAKAGLLAADLATIVGISAVTAGKWFRGASRPVPHMLHYARAAHLYSVLNAALTKGTLPRADMPRKDVVKKISKAVDTRAAR